MKRPREIAYQIQQKSTLDLFILSLAGMSLFFLYWIGTFDTAVIWLVSFTNFSETTIQILCVSLALLTASVYFGVRRYRDIVGYLNQIEEFQDDYFEQQEKRSALQEVLSIATYTVRFIQSRLSAPDEGMELFLGTKADTNQAMIISWDGPGISKIIGFVLKSSPDNRIDWWVSRIHPEDRAKTEKIIRQWKIRKKLSFEYRIRNVNGEWRWISEQIVVGKNASGNLDFLTGILMDITDRKIMENKLLTSERQVQEAQRIAELGYWDFDPQTRTFNFSEGVYQILALEDTSQKLTQEQALNVLYPEDVSASKGYLDPKSDTPPNFDLYLKIKTYKGETRFIHIRGEWTLEEGRKVDCHGTVQDITDYWKANQKTETYTQLSQELNSVTTVNEAGKVIAAATRRLIPFDAGLMIYLETGTQRPHLFFYEDPLSDSKVDSTNPIDCRMWKYIEKTLQEGDSLHIKRTEADNDPLLIPSWIGIPVQNGGQTVGAMVFLRHEAPLFNHSDIETLRGIASHCAGALDRISIATNLKKYVEIQENLVQNLIDGILIFKPEGALIFHNSPALEILKIHTKDLYKLTLKDLIDPQDWERIQKRLEENATEDFWKTRMETRFIRVDQQPIDVEISMAQMEYHDKQQIMVIFRDITQQKQKEKLVYDMAIRDSLTQLYNHHEFYRRLADEIERSRRYNQTCAVIMADVDFFKRVNDTYGHPVGDKMLRHIAQLLQDSLRQVDLVARYGGEEFAIILPQQGSKDALMLAERLRKIVEENPLKIEEQVIPVTISLGVSLYPFNAITTEELVQVADQNLYLAKHSGRNCVRPTHVSETKPFNSDINTEIL